MEIIDRIDIDFLQNRINDSLSHIKGLSFHRAERKYHTEFLGPAISGIDDEHVQDHFIPLYWFGHAIVCEHQSWVNGEFKEVIGMAVGRYYEWMSNDSPEDSGWTWDDGSPDFEVILTLNKNQLECKGCMAKAILEANL